MTNKDRLVEGDIAIVTKSNGRQYVGIWTLAPGIDWFWREVPDAIGDALWNHDVSYKVIGRVSI
jgi:hypothetical protein